MGTGASRAGNKSVNALRVIKRRQRPVDNSAHSENNHYAFDQKLKMPVTQVQNGQANVQKAIAEKDDTQENSANDQTTVKKPAQKTEDCETKPGEPSKVESDSDDNDDETQPNADCKGEAPVLTEEEMRQLIDVYYEKLTSVISTWKAIPVRDSSQENEPYTQEFSAFVLKLTKSYFRFKPGKIPYSLVKEYRLQVGKFLSDTKCLEYICDATADAFKRQDFCSEGKSKITFFLPLKNCVLCQLNYSDASRDVKLCIGSHEKMLTCFVNLINEWKDPYLQKELSDNLNKLLKWCISIFHNCAALDENVPLLRDIGVIQAVLPYLDSSVSKVRLSTIATLADIVNEEEAELLQANQSIFKFLLKTLRLAINDGAGHKNLGWSAEELTRAVRQLSRNDANKKILVDLGCLPLLNSLLTVGNDDEIKETLDCLWILSFDDVNKEAMMCEGELVEHVVDQYHQGSGTMKYSCHGLLWSLKEQLLRDEKFKEIGNEVSTFKGQHGIEKELSPLSPDAPEGEESTGHVLISYQWGNQEMIKHIVQELRANNIPVWLDIDYMGGSTLQAMARAVENSFAVIVAMSQKYKDSPNTRAEAEYAFQQRKTIIPLKMQKGYRPDGWLGLILGSKLYYDFSGKYSFESRMKGLLKAVMDINDGDVRKKPEQPLMIGTKAAVVTSPTKPIARSVPGKENEIKAWTNEDVKQWLAKFKLDKVDAMTKLSGEEIVFLFHLKHEAPEFFYRTLETKLQLQSLLDLSRATDAICGFEI